MKYTFFTHTRYAFTMIEMIMVIVILGIVSSIGASIISDLFQSYTIQRGTHRASIKTEIVAEQIANLLSYRIPKTTIARDPSNPSDIVEVTTDTGANDTTHRLLEWIGDDSDGFKASLPPPWSGFCDIDPSNQTSIRTPGTDLTLESTIMSNLSNSKVSLSGGQYPAIFFKNSGNFYQKIGGSGTNPYSYACMGYTDTSCISTVSSNANKTLTFQLNAGVTTKLISEQYKLAWTAYAIEPVQVNGHTNLVLHWNYQPWAGESYSDGYSSTLITNVTVFKFAESGNAVRFKICAQDNIGLDHNITICKEKAVLL